VIQDLKSIKLLPHSKACGAVLILNCRSFKMSLDTAATSRQGAEKLVELLQQ